MGLRVRQPGFRSWLVDAGRPGCRSLGVPLGGAADRAAFRLANALVGNASDAPALEVTLSGPTLVAEHPAACAVFGAPFHLLRDGSREIAPGTAFTLEAGDVLKTGGTPGGCRAYLAVAGGFDVPESLGSRSAWREIEAGEVLKCRPSRIRPRGLGFYTLDEPRTTLRAVPGTEAGWFDDTFWNIEYRVGPASDRMGLRLLGPPLDRRPGEMASAAVAPGAVQVANDGRPIVLGVDGQTIGGYPKVAHVIAADLDRLAQLRPGEAVRFLRVTVEEAEALANARRRTLGGWVVRLLATAAVESA